MASWIQLFPSRMIKNQVKSVDNILFVFFLSLWRVRSFRDKANGKQKTIVELMKMDTRDIFMLLHLRVLRVRGHEKRAPQLRLVILITPSDDQWSVESYQANDCPADLWAWTAVIGEPEEGLKPEQKTGSPVTPRMTSGHYEFQTCDVVGIYNVLDTRFYRCSGFKVTRRRRWSFIFRAEFALGN